MEVSKAFLFMLALSAFSFFATAKHSQSYNTPLDVSLERFCISSDCVVIDKKTAEILFERGGEHYRVFYRIVSDKEAVVRVGVVGMTSFTEYALIFLDSCWVITSERGISYLE